MNAKTLIVFNHKGGASKTQTTYNIAWMLTEKGKRVLLVDCDPQCNLSSLLLRDNFYDYYTDSKTKTMNIKDGLRTAFEGRPMPIRAVDCYVCPCNDKLLLLPGHMDLPEYETSLNLAIQNNYSMTTLQNLPGALFELTRLCAEKYNVDYVFFDVSAGLGVINQVAFISSDAFIVPTNPDPFSLMALQTLSKTLPRWKRWADLTRPSLADASYPLPDVGMKFLGEVCLKYSKRKIPPTISCSKTIADIKEFVSCSFVQTLDKYGMVYKRSEYRMAEIPDFAPLLPAAMETGVPVSALPEEDASVRAADLRATRNDLHDIFSSIADIIIGTVK